MLEPIAFLRRRSKMMGMSRRRRISLAALAACAAVVTGCSPPSYGALVVTKRGGGEHWEGSVSLVRVSTAAGGTVARGRFGDVGRGGESFTVRLRAGTYAVTTSEHPCPGSCLDTGPPQSRCSSDVLITPHEVAEVVMHLQEDSCSLDG